MDLLLQILEEGRLTDSFGRKVDFRNTIVIMTSNLGADLIKKTTEIGFGVVEGSLDYDRIKEKIEAEVKKRFKPEFLNRLNDVVIFHPLNRGNLLQVITLEINKLQKRLNNRDVYIQLDEAACNFLVEQGFQPEMGARPLRRVIEQFLEDPLAEKLLMNPNEGRRCKVTVQDGKIIFIDEEVFLRHIQDKQKEQKK